VGRIYFYKLMADNGGAPCVERGLLSLAICKPMIRRAAREGDLIFGFAANSLHRDNRLVYAARITKKLTEGGYYTDNSYANRGDCVYRFEAGRFVWRKGAKYHGPQDLIHDLGPHPDYPRANVLLSKDFRYFGGAGSDEYKVKFGRVKTAVESLGRGQRVHHDKALFGQLLDMADWIWAISKHKKIGYPTSAPSRSVCHRSRPCGVVVDDDSA
jgi:Nucleotide modification associated domain 2